MGYKLKGDIKDYLNALSKEAIEDEFAQYEMTDEEINEKRGILKAVYTSDIMYHEMPVFEFNLKTSNFEHEELFYHFAIVMNDPNWQVYVTNGELFYPVENMKRVPEEDIFDLISK